MRFNWRKRGMVFDATKHAFPKWASHSVLQPTPLLLEDGAVIRFYVGMRDTVGQSRVGYIDVSSQNPSEILDISSDFFLDIGVDGCFDDAGVVPSAIYSEGGIHYLYYAGYSLLNKVRFSVLGGLAISKEGGIFERTSLVPTFERTNQHTLFRVPHTILKEGDVFRIWYGGGNHFFEMNNYTYPVYDIYYCETDDLSRVPKEGVCHLSFQNDDEYRVARPYVVKKNNIYCMFLCVATKSKGYRLGYAESVDGINWIRCDKKLNLDISESGWDSEMMGYPSFVETKYGTYLFYNGNEFGKRGFGYAVLG